jgi:hypothetical protein
MTLLAGGMGKIKENRLASWNSTMLTKNPSPSQVFVKKVYRTAKLLKDSQLKQWVSYKIFCEHPHTNGGRLKIPVLMTAKCAGACNLERKGLIIVRPSLSLFQPSLWTRLRSESKRLIDKVGTA